jgi:Fe(3+) dicitrate transport protein
MIKLISSTLVSVLLTVPVASVADEVPTKLIEEVVVIGSRDDVQKIAGSGGLIEEEQLDRMDYTDLNQILSSIPGVYFREEDGYGLRPNIGIRGATTDRSQKITMMEDGILIGPAPYSAPAAYYVPNVARHSSIEVLKGPASIKYGPHTVGGAINYVTKDLSEPEIAEIDLSGGSDGYYKFQTLLGKNFGQISVLLDALRYQSDGFKSLDNGGDTGFERNDVNIKIKWTPDTEKTQSLSVKLGYADEDADETYLGLTQSDFATDPIKRYPASQLDNFQSEHRQLHINYALQASQSTRINIKAYVNEFERAWNKFDGLMSGTAPQSILTKPELYTNQYRVLSGQLDSTGAESDTIDVTNNDREFSSRGLQLSSATTYTLSGLDNELAFGLRLHKDEVDRDHKKAGYLMRSANLVDNDIEYPSKVTNHAETQAVSVYLANRIFFKKLEVELGLRYEDIEGEITNYLLSTTKENNQSKVLPGISALWDISSQTSLFAGIHTGYSPRSPGSSADQAEESTNYEFGIRYSQEDKALEIVGFHSDYENLLGRCRVSDFGCNPGEEFSGGEVNVSGAELSGTVGWAFDNALNLSLSANYTYTSSEFQESFLSTFSQFGLVREGDELPYLPEHIARVEVLVARDDWEILGAIKHQSSMREEPGQGPISLGVYAEELTVIDLSASWHFSEAGTAQILLTNVADEQKIVAHRPFGARPNRPFSAALRVKYRIR